MEIVPEGRPMGAGIKPGGMSRLVIFRSSLPGLENKRGKGATFALPGINSWATFGSSFQRMFL